MANETREKLVPETLDFVNFLFAQAGEEYFDLFFEKNNIVTFEHAIVCSLSELANRMQAEVATYPNLVVIDREKNKIAANAIRKIRDKNTPPSEFRRYLKILSDNVLSLASQFFPSEMVELDTPLESTRELQVNSGKILSIVVMRAALGMKDSVGDNLPEVEKMGFADIARNEVTLDPEEKSWKVPKIDKETVVLIIDPMLATGGTDLHILRKVAESNPKKIVVVSALAAPEGIREIHNEFPDVPIVTGVVDKRLNGKGYIVPGLGDAGDRQFGPNDNGNYQP